MAELIYQVIFVIVAGIAAARLAKRLRIPEIIPLLIAGYILGRDVLNLISPEQLGVSLDSIAIAAASVILFYDGLKAEPRSFLAQWKSVLSISTIAVAVTVAGIALFSHFVLGFSVLAALLLGAILSSTDPASIVPMLRKLNVNKRISSILEAETAFNDATAIALFLVFFSAASGATFSFQTFFQSFFYVALSSIAIGLAIGVAAREALRTFHIARDLTFASIVVLMTTFAVSEALGASGVIAAVVSALVFGSYVRSAKVDSVGRLSVLKAWEELNFLAIAFIFIILGSLVQVSAILPFLLLGVAIALAFTFVVRPVTILVSMAFDSSYSLREKLFISWVGGPRGSVSAALASLVLSSYAITLGAAASNAIFSVTLVVIGVTVLITSSTSLYAARKLLGATENDMQEKYRMLTTELKSMMIASKKLRDDYRNGFLSSRMYEEIDARHKALMLGVEKELAKVTAKNPALGHKERALKARELLVIQVNALEEAYENKEISEEGYLALLDKYNTMLSRLSELEGVE